MDILRYAAFTADPAGGNPAGVVLDATGAGDAEMQRVAAEVGYSETAFLVPAGGGGRFTVRYFSPKAEVPFCGHATIASAVAYAQRHGPGVLHLDTRAGLVEVATSVQADGATTATLTSVAPRTVPLAADDLAALLAALRWSPDDLDATLPPRVAYAGAWHPIVAAETRQRLADLDYDTAALSALMAERDWTTIDLVHRESPLVFHARNPFPPGGVVEDAATGAAAAAFGGYLRELGLVRPPATVTVRQGDDMGRPSLLTVSIPAGDGAGIAVTGTAVPIPADDVRSGAARS
ncbi:MULTISPECIES: PhzF family phenazine biosynthesis isomerase [unclassified Micromonospora]|uniref:PhzF family phenazine biosynthesis protein n=1 Tax=unclassified Micromonospora TaxID=2617518 RepID=UPI00188FC097|nr:MULTISPECIES: PhzF family phenazine biosynthesis isomerase [unclassified Micromonospora]MBF5031994.1 PhzF family phenazine biosynthesis isomerase [Micromonospora sp. ANENR4]WBC05662.1 PhzF family phenazine biosynthesis isomerase [Micromonospora sp. WMMA1976]